MGRIVCGPFQGKDRPRTAHWRGCYGKSLKGNYFTRAAPLAYSHLGSRACYFQSLKFVCHPLPTEQ
jgi:hypothetical protein